MLKLSPSILSADFANLGEDVRSIERAGADFVHIDVMDGNFVPNISFGIPVIKSIRPCSNLVFDVHLMIDDPIRYIKNFADSGADIITFHYEACKDAKQVIDKIHSFGKLAGISIKPNTDTDVIEKYIDDVDMVLIMTVEPGFGGQKLILKTLDKIKEVKKLCIKHNRTIDIEADGGITLENVKDVAASGANVIVAGSAVFGASDIREAIKQFKNS